MTAVRDVVFAGDQLQRGLPAAVPSSLDQFGDFGVGFSEIHSVDYLCGKRRIVASRGCTASSPAIHLR